MAIAALCMATLGMATVCAGSRARAQMHHVDAPQKVTRAVGVYEWTGDLNKPAAARFVPVSLFIDGHFEDAGLYLARPVPFALQSGDLYTVERAGEPEGLFDLDLAARVVSGNALADDNPVGAWYGFGKFTAAAPPKPPPPLHGSAHVGVIQSSTATGIVAVSPPSTGTDDGRPHMSRRSSGTDATPSDSTGAAGSSTPTTPRGTGSSGDSGSSGSSGKVGDDDTDRPTLARRDPTQDATRRRSSGGKGGTASVTAVGPAPGDDPDRPTLSHNTAAAENTKELTGLPPDLHQAVAVSDAVSRDPHPFARPWEGPADRGSTLAAMAALARPTVLAYLKENRLVPSAAPPAGVGGASTASSSTEGVAADTENGAGAPPKLQRGRPTEYGAGSPTTPTQPTATQPVPTHPAPAHPAHPSARVSAHPPTHAASRHPASLPLALRDEQVTGFTLSYGGLPTFVYTATATAALSGPGEPDVTPASAGAHPTIFITVVAQRLPSGDLQVALSNVTDSAHLDRGPRLRLIDAVDPDASHRASLLLELRGGSSRQFALYRLTSARAQNTFTSASIE